MNDRNHMLDAQGHQEIAGPDRTIVGGRPPEHERLLPVLPTGIQKLLVAASLDEGFLHSLLADPVEAARTAGLTLRPSEVAVLSAVPREQLRSMAERMHVADPGRRGFLMKSAAAALAIVAGTVLPGCGESTFRHRSGGIRPDVPPDLPPLFSWLTSLDEAMAAAVESSRPVLVYFWYDPKYRPDGTIRNPEIVGGRPILVSLWFDEDPVRSAVVSERFLNVLIVHPDDMEWGPGQEAEKQEAWQRYQATLASCKVESFPTILFLAPDGTELGREVQPTQEFMLITAIGRARDAFYGWLNDRPPTDDLRP